MTRHVLDRSAISPLAAVLLIVACSAVAEAAPPAFSPLQATMPPVGVPSPSPTVSLQGEPYYTLEDKAQQRFLNGFMTGDGIASLDADAKAFRDSKALFETGEYKLAVFYRGASLPMLFPNALAQLDAWIAAAPQSPTGQIVKAQVRLEELTRRLSSAFYTRQGAQSAELDAGALTALRDELLAHEKVLATDPHWYYLLVRIAMLLHEPEKVVTDTVMRGLRVAPGYRPLLDAGTDYFMPKWSGSSEGLARWSRAVDEEPSQKATGAYAQIHLHAFQVQYGKALFDQTGIDWERFKASARAWVPATNSLEVRSDVAMIACLSGDRQETRRLFAISKEPLYFRPWGSRENRDLCQAWAEMPAWKTWVMAIMGAIDGIVGSIAERLRDLLMRS